MPAQQGPQINISTVRITYILYNAIIRAANQGNAQARTILQNAQALDRPLRPINISSIIDLQDNFGNIHNLMQLLVQAGVLSQSVVTLFTPFINKELDYLQYASRVSRLPELALKYRNMIPQFDSDGNLEDLTSCSPSEYIAHRQSLGPADQLKLDHLNINNIPLNRRQLEEYHELIRAVIRAYNLPPLKRQQVLDRLQETMRSFETNLISFRRIDIKNRRRIHDVEAAAIETEDKLSKQRDPSKLQAYKKEQSVKDTILASLNLEWAGDQRAIPVPQLHEMTTTPPSTPSARSTLGQVKSTLRYSPLISPGGNVNRSGLDRSSPEVRGTVKTLEYTALVDDIEADVKESILDQYQTFNGEDPYLRDKVAQEAAHFVAIKIAYLMQESLEADTGIKEANTVGHLFDKCLERDVKLRAQFGKEIVGALSRYHPPFAQEAYLDHQQSRAYAYINGAIDGVLNRPDTAVTHIKLSIPRSNTKVIEVTKTVEIPDYDHLDHIIRGVTHSIVGPSMIDITRSFNEGYQLGKWTEDQALEVNEAVFGENRSKHLESQEKWAKLAGDMARDFTRDPLGTTFRAPLLLAWNFAPDFIKESSIGERAGLFATAAFPLIGPGPALGMGLAHANLLLQTEINKKYGLLVNPIKTVRSYYEGFVRYLVSFHPFTKTDLIGRPTYGIQLIPAGWNILTDLMGQRAIRAYDNKFLSLGRSQAKEYSKSFGGDILKRIGIRWKDTEKRRDPISLFIIAPLWEITKAATLQILEATGLAPGLVSFLKGNELGNLSKAWSYGGGWANIGTIIDLQNTALGSLFKDVKPFSTYTPPVLGGPAIPGPLTFYTSIPPDAQRYFDQVQKINNQFTRLYKVGRFVQGSSGVWSGIKIGIGGALRGLVTYGLTFMLTGNPVAAVAISSIYSGGWALRQLLTTPVFSGGFIGWQQIGDQLVWVGKYTTSGILSNVPFLGNLAKVMNTPISQLKTLTDVSGGMKAFGTAFKLFPSDGIFIGSILASLGLGPIGFWAPVGIDLGIKLFSELRKGKFFGKFFSAVGPWAQATSIIGNIFNLGSLSYALDISGFTGLFDVFRHFTIPNLMKFMTLPGMYLSTLGTMAAFGAGASTLVLGMPAWIAAGAITGGIVITDQILRLLGITHGLWTPFKLLLDKLFEFLKTHGLNFASGVVSLVAGFFGLIQSAIKGDIQGISISLVMLIVGGVLTFATTSGATFPLSYYTPTEAAEADVHENAYITNAFKDFKKINDTKDQLTYEYKFSIEKFKDNDIKSITISENDVFKKLPGDNVVSIKETTEPKKLKPDTTLEGDLNVTALNQTYSDPSYVDNDIKIQREFTITLSKPLNEIVGDDGKLCNMLWITIDEVKKNDGTTYKPLVTDITHSICIDINGDVTDTESVSGAPLTNLPIDPAKVSFISSCFYAKSEGFHGGIDFAAAEGTEVYSPADGTVKEKYYQNDPNIPIDFDFKSLGNVIIIKHNMNKTTIYGHLSGFGKDDLGDGNELEVGDKVSAGQVIAYVGKTGNSTGSHLHFMTKDDSGFYNPCLESTLKICDGAYHYEPGKLEEVHGEGVDKCSSTPKRAP